VNYSVSAQGFCGTSRVHVLPYDSLGDGDPEPDPVPAPIPPDIWDYLASQTIELDDTN